MYDYDPNYYIADGSQNHNKLAMAPPHEFNDYGEKRPKPPFVPYGPKPPICPCQHSHGQPEKLPPVKRPEHPESYYIHPPYIPSAEECKCQIKDRFPVSNIINVESQLLITLKITLYGVKEEDDVTVILENGKQYKFTYVTEEGVKQITGILRYIDSSIPTSCIRYIGESNNVTDYAYIIVDGSSAGNSNIVKIFIRSLRGIEEIKEETTDDNNSNSESSNNNESESNSENNSESSESESDSNNDSESDSLSSSESDSTSESNSGNSTSESENHSESSSESNSELGSNSETESLQGSENTSEYESENISGSETATDSEDAETTTPDYSSNVGDSNA